jgi:hypothetical protein
MCSVRLKSRSRRRLPEGHKCLATGRLRPRHRVGPTDPFNERTLKVRHALVVCSRRPTLGHRAAEHSLATAARPGPHGEGKSCGCPQICFPAVDTRKLRSIRPARIKGNTSTALRRPPCGPEEAMQIQRWPLRSKPAPPLLQRLNDHRFRVGPIPGRRQGHRNNRRLVRRRQPLRH